MPSRLITHTGGMAAPMDVTEGDGGGGKGSSSSSKGGLSVSRSSVKINKSNMRRAMTQPRPAPQVYKTEPAEFRSLVQRLTGTESSSSASASLVAPKPLNPRLQKIAPPPLRPVFSYPNLQQALPQQQFNPGPRRSFLSGLASYNTPTTTTTTSTTPRHSNFPVSPLSFSPLPALSPGDQIWANVLNNPGTPLAPPPATATTATTTSPMDFNQFALLGSLFTPSSLSMDDTFSFPDPDHHIPRSRFS